VPFFFFHLCIVCKINIKNIHLHLDFAASKASVVRVEWEVVEVLVDIADIADCVDKNMRKFTPEIRTNSVQNANFSSCSQTV